jgi:hypothetical protein
MPGADVADRDADARRRFRPAGDRGDAGLGLDQHVVGLALGVGAGVAIARDRADDQPRVILAESFDGEAELGHRAGLEVLDEHVGLGQHGFEQRLVFRLGQIHHHGFLAAVEPDEIGALALRQRVIAAREIALRPLDLDDARPRVGEAARAHRRGDGLFERDDEEA